MDKILEVLAKNLRRLRKERGFKSREAFAEAARMPFPTYRGIESGESWPEKPNIEKIAKALGVEERELFQDVARAPTPAQALEVLSNALSDSRLTLPENLTKDEIRVARQAILALRGELKIEGLKAAEDLG